MNSTENPHKSGFVSIIGRPNVGKSTLLMALMGEKISIISPKAQTTRHRIMGIYSDEQYQIVFSDTPGVIEPKYPLHESMMDFVDQSLEDADVVIIMVELGEKNIAEPIKLRLQNLKIPKLVLINKIDLGSQEEVMNKINFWINEFPDAIKVLPVSALNYFNTPEVLDIIKSLMPENPPYFDKEQLTDKSERFIASEIIREKIFMRYEKEIPYSVEVEIESFKEEEDIIHISAVIYVEREGQKGILIGQKGMALKNVGTAARKEMENFFKKKIFLKTFVKIKEDWRNDVKSLKKFGYKE